MAENYQRMLDETIKHLNGVRKKLLLHACCAPCSSYVLEYLNVFFDITLFFYNPNIAPFEEFSYRAEELKRLVEEMPLINKPEIVVCDYEGEKFNQIAKGLESLPEGGARCFSCYAMRLEKTAAFAVDNGFDYFCTTLSISPYKNAIKLNEIGENLSEKYKINYLYADFKKKNGYKRSIELSNGYHLYRQNYCGCIFSKQAADERERQR